MFRRHIKRLLRRIRPVPLAGLAAALLAATAFAAFATDPDPVTTAIDPTAAYKVGLIWDYPPYLLVDLPAQPGDILITQGPFPHIAPVMQKRGFITGHAGLYNGRKDVNGDGIEEYACAEAARYGVWYGYYYPLYRFEKGHGRLDEWLEKDGELAKFMKGVFGQDLSNSALVKKYDDVLDGTFMGARTVDLVSENPREYEIRRKILEFSHTYVLKNCDYSYDSFVQPVISLFHSLNGNGTGGYGAGHCENFTCVGLSEAAYQYAGVDVTPRFVEETNAGLTPYKQFSYTKPVSKLHVGLAEKTRFDVWHVLSGHRTFEPGVAADPIPAGCTFDGKTFAIDGAVLGAGTHEVEFRSLVYPDQHQKVRIIVGGSPLPTFDLKNVEIGFTAVDAADAALKTRVDALVAGGDREKEIDKALLGELSNARTVNDVVAVARNIANGSARDLACLYGLKYATRIEDLYKLAMFADSASIGSKILYAPVGFSVTGLDGAIAKAMNSEAWFSLTFNHECGKLVKTLLASDYKFERSVDLGLALTFADVSRLDAKKIAAFLDRMIADPKALNAIENAYLISLIQKRVYFGLSDGDPAAREIQALVKVRYDAARARISADGRTNRSNVVEDDRVVARFLQSMAESLDVERGWLDTALAAEKSFLTGVYMTAGAAPGIGPAFGALAAGSVTGRLSAPFEKIYAHGALSPALQADIAARNPAAEFVDAASGRPMSAAAPAPAAAQTTLPATPELDGLIPPSAVDPATLPPEAAEAYRRYQSCFQKFTEALGAGDPNRPELDGLREELRRAGDEYRALAPR